MFSSQLLGRDHDAAGPRSLFSQGGGRGGEDWGSPRAGDSIGQRADPTFQAGPCFSTTPGVPTLEKQLPRAEQPCSISIPQPFPFFPIALRSSPCALCPFIYQAEFDSPLHRRFPAALGEHWDALHLSPPDGTSGASCSETTPPAAGKPPDHGTAGYWRCTENSFFFFAQLFFISKLCNLKKISSTIIQLRGIPCLLITKT